MREGDVKGRERKRDEVVGWREEEDEKEGGAGWGVSHQSRSGEKKARCWLWECAVHGSREWGAGGDYEDRGGSRVVISQAFGRESERGRGRGSEREGERQSPPGPTGIAPPRG